MPVAVELLLVEWKPRSLAPVTAAGVAASAVVLLMGSIPLSGAGVFMPHLLWLDAAVLGAIAGLASGAITESVNLAEDWYRRLPIHGVCWPALETSTGSSWPRAVAVGYPTIRALDEGSMG